MALRPAAQIQNRERSVQSGRCTDPDRIVWSLEAFFSKASPASNESSSECTPVPNVHIAMVRAPRKGST